MSNLICKICGNEYPLLLSLSKHLTNKHHYVGGLVQYYVDYENFAIPKCLYCDNDAKREDGLKYRKTCGDKKCIKKIPKSHTDETKLKLSKILIEAHRSGKNTGWDFINSDKNRRSYPEKWFIKNVLEKYNLYDKYTIEEKMSFGKYYLDFAILDLKIDVEIDGSQHFRTEEAIIHDLERDKFVLSNDWKVYRIAWIELKNNRENVVSDFLNWIDQNDKTYYKYDISETLDKLKKPKIKYRIYNVEKLKIKKSSKYGSSSEYFLNRKNQYDLKQISNIEKIINSDIDFSKEGWVKKVSTIIGISENKGSNWMKRNMNIFYINNCWKRKSPNKVL